MPAASTDRPHPLFARLYARLSPGMEEAGMGSLRDELLAGLAGRVLEVGAGNGLNFGHYPTEVTAVVAVEPEPHLRRLATAAAGGARVPVSVVPGTAGALPLEAASVDAAIVCLVLCSVADHRGAFAELRRVIRPGGELRFLEHVVAESPVLRRVQRVADATFWPRIAGGCHTATDPLPAMRDAGFEVISLRRLRFPDTRVSLPATPHVLGVAQRV